MPGERGSGQQNPDRGLQDGNLLKSRPLKGNNSVWLGVEPLQVLLKEGCQEVSKWIES
jgi:hypothetical protein